MSEEWRKIDGWPYEVTRNGMVRHIKGNIKKQQIDNLYGRPIVYLWKDGKRKLLKIHRLVLIAFGGPQPAGMECCHINGDKLDNRIENLRWGTKKENMADQYLHGVRIMGEKVSTSKLTTEQVIEIKNSKGKLKAKELSKRFNIHERHVYALWSGERWSAAIEKYTKVMGT